MTVKTSEVTYKSALGKSRLPGYDYCLNPYVGCQHGCIYCYAGSYSLRAGRKEKWGSFVDIKSNLLSTLTREIRSKPRGVVGLSTITDSYQPIEEKTSLTRRCITALLDSGFDVTIQTKSRLVERDLDVLQEHPKSVDVGFTITTMDLDIASKIEPAASSPLDRVTALRRTAEAGLQTWIFVGPILPHVTDTGIDDVLDVAASIPVDNVLIDKLNMRPGVWASIRSFLEADQPELVNKYKKIFWGESDFYRRLKDKVSDTCRRRNLSHEFCF